MSARSRESRPAPKSTKEKRDDDIMLTNDSSIVSKQSVVKLYRIDQPDFFRPFVAKSQRRSPLINRGYWLRMKAIEHTVSSFLEESRGKDRLVINLGCGYDPLPFYFLHEQSELCSRTTFVDVDYPQLMLTKRACISKSAFLQELFPTFASKPSSTNDIWHAGQYLAVGCDLRKLAELEDILQKEARIHECAILFIAEVSVAYMDVRSADTVVSWASSFKDARFCILEQCLPEGPGHPFARTMLSHFEKLHTHLKVVYEYPTLSAQESRFCQAGWAQAKARTLWELWSDDDFLPPDQRRVLDSIEPFDEWEEFALFGGHYLLLVARTSDAATPATQEPSENATQLPLHERLFLHLHSHPHHADASLRRFGATYSHGQKVVIHGGYGEQSRLGDFSVYSSNAAYESKIDRQHVGPGELMCHTVTNVASGDDLFLLAGGRGSPSKVSDKIWLATSTGRCISADSFNSDHIFNGRYRHCAVPVFIGSRNDAPGVLIYGGKSDAKTVLGDFLLFDLKKQSWCNVPYVGSDTNGDVPPLRFGASMCKFDIPSTESNLEQQAGILMGGISEHGSILDDVWTWSLHWQNGHPLIKCKNKTLEIRQCDRASTYARFGATLLPSLEGKLLLIGGVARDRMLKLDEEILLLSINSKDKVQRVQLPPFPSSRPLFVGVSVAKVQDRIVLVGGGAVCFSMGSFWNTQSYSLELKLEQERQLQPTSTKPSSTESEEKAINGTRVPTMNRPVQSSSVALKTVERINIRTKEDFDSIVNRGQPVILTGLEIGPCVSLWTPEYLLSKIGADRPVIVHSCPTSRMTFQTKNFSYIKQSFGEFMADVTAGKQLYLRSVASTQPAKHATNLSKDFPAIAADFRLPDALASATENMHSSPLRISGPVILWLHYDVLANVLCQIRGTKRLRLYPPGDVAHLAYPPGSSSSNIDVYAPAEELSDAQRTELLKTHPHEAFLRPGDVLFIPPAWSHTAKPEEGLSVAVNCFWRNLDAGVYAQGRDVYGNRDIAAYEEGRKAVEKVAKGFEGVPKDLQRFYLERLVGELREKVEALDVDGNGVGGEESG